MRCHDTAESKAAQRLLESLTADGLTAAYTKTVKTTRVRLTPASDERAPLAWLPTVGDALEVVRSVLEHELARNVCMRHMHADRGRPRCC